MIQNMTPQGKRINFHAEMLTPQKSKEKFTEIWVKPKLPPKPLATSLPSCTDIFLF